MGRHIVRQHAMKARRAIFTDNLGLVARVLAIPRRASGMHWTASLTPETFRSLSPWTFWISAREFSSFVRKVGDEERCRFADKVLRPSTQVIPGERRRSTCPMRPCATVRHDLVVGG